MLTIAALEAAIEQGASVVCLQEPYIGKKRNISHLRFQIRWPECEEKEKRHIRVALAIRNDVLEHYVFEERTDLISNAYVQCLDVQETRQRIKTRRTRLINVYSRARIGNGGYAIDRIDLAQLLKGRTILAGDFNARSLAWDPWTNKRYNAGTTEYLIETYNLIINNNDQATRHRASC
jgi:hypothetical protein